MSPSLGERGYIPPLWLCYSSRGPRWREEHVIKIHHSVPVIKDAIVDWGKSILVPPRLLPLARAVSLLLNLEAA